MIAEALLTRLDHRLPFPVRIVAISAFIRTSSAGYKVSDDVVADRRKIFIVKERPIRPGKVVKIGNRRKIDMRSTVNGVDDRPLSVSANNNIGFALFGFREKKEVWTAKYRPYFRISRLDGSGRLAPSVLVAGENLKGREVSAPISDNLKSPGLNASFGFMPCGSEGGGEVFEAERLMTDPVVSYKKDFQSSPLFHVPCDKKP